MSQTIPKIVRGYEIDKEIGRGGFGAVYRAYQPILKREVALKVILPEYANNPDFIRRFEREAEIVAQLEHPFIVPLFDYWREPNGAYLAMRLIQGGSLSNRLREGALSLEEVIQLYEQITSALSKAHRRQVVHRDIKPANILLDEDKNAYLTDFGIALSPNYDVSSEDMAGTIHYAAPEQFTGTGISPKTDIYALGIVLYELLAGKNPYIDYKSYEIFSKILNEPVNDVRELNPDLSFEVNEVIQRAAAKDPEERFEDVREIATALRACLGSSFSISISEEEVDLPNPYKGLEAFQEYDRFEFYGRDALIEQLLKRMANTDDRFLAVVGPSGSGKSSVVKAGLLPRLREGALQNSENWFIVDMFPNTNPFAELETALLQIAVNTPSELLEQLKGEDGISRAIKRVLPEKDSEILLIIDQFEELFTLLDDETRRKTFINNLMSALRDPRSRLRVIITLRADFYDRPLMYGELGQLIRKHTEIVLPLTREELQAAIVQPAANVGAYYQPALLEALLDDVQEQAGILPLLQYALTQLFERRTGHEIKFDDYQAMGTVSGILKKRAEELYEQFNEHEKQASQQLFLRLVTLGEGTEDTRRRVLQSELNGIEHLESVLKQLDESRLLRFDRDAMSREPTIELAHETLIRTWERLREWLRNSREDLRIHRRLSAQTTDWKAASEDESFLATGTRLEQFQFWADNSLIALSAEEKRFLDTSIDAQSKRRALDKARKAEELRIANRAANFQRASVVLGVVSLIALVATAIAIVISVGANNDVFAIRETVIPSMLNTAATEVGAAENYAASLRLAASAQNAYNNGNASLGLSLAYTAGTIADAPQTSRIIRELAYLPNPIALHDLDSEGIILNMILSPNGSRYVTAASDGRVSVWDTATHQELSVYHLGTGLARGLAMSSDGKLLAYGACVDESCGAATIEIIDLEADTILQSLNGHQDEITALDFSADGQRLLSASFDETLRLWELSTGASLAILQANGSLWDASFSPDGHMAVSSSEDIILWNLETNTAQATLTGHTGIIHAAKFSPDGTQLFTAADDWQILIWDITSQTIQQRLVGHSASVVDLSLSPDSTHLLSSSINGEIILWDLVAGDLQASLRAYGSDVWAIAYLPDGLSALSAGVNTTFEQSDYSIIIQWDLQAGDQLQRFHEHNERVWDLAFSPDGSNMLSVSDDDSVIVWDTADFSPIMSLQAHTDNVRHAAFSPDGLRVLSASEDDSIILWDVQTGQPLNTYRGHSDDVMNVAWHPDGRRFLSASKDQKIFLWDSETGEILHQYEGHSNTVRALIFLSGGERFLSASYDKTIRLWNTESGELIRSYNGHSDLIIGLAINSDESLFATSSRDNSIILWNLETGDMLRRFYGHDHLVSDVSFSQDNTMLISSSWDGRLILWDIASGEQLYSYRGHGVQISALGLLPNSEHLVSVAENGDFIVWRLQNLSQLMAWMESNRAIRPLTCSEQIEFSLLETDENCD